MREEAREDTLFRLLGGVRAIGARLRSDLDFDEEIRRGFRRHVFESFKGNTKLSNTAISRVLGVSPRTLDRLVVVHEADRLKPAVSDRLYRAAKVIAFAEEVLGGRDQAMQWLSRKAAGLGDRIPLELMETDAGTREVEEELQRIEHGFVA